MTKKGFFFQKIKNRRIPNSLIRAQKCVPTNALLEANNIESETTEIAKIDSFFTYNFLNKF
jgi:hypothetical protein